MSLAEARRRFEDARKAARAGNGIEALKLATESWNEARTHQGDPAWDAFAQTVFAELPALERSVAQKPRSDPSDSTTLILK